MLSTQPLKWQDIIFPILGATWFFFRPGVRSCIFVVQLLNCVWFFATPWTAARQASLSSPVSRSLLRFMSVESVMLSISSSAASFYLPSFSTSGSFPLSYLFTSGGQGIGASASASVIPVNIQGWFPFQTINLSDNPPTSQPTFRQPSIQLVISSCSEQCSVPDIESHLTLSPTPLAPTSSLSAVT